MSEGELQREKMSENIDTKATLLGRTFSIFQLISPVFKLFSIMDYITFPSTRVTLKISNWQSSLQSKHFSLW